MGNIIYIPAPVIIVFPTDGLVMALLMIDNEASVIPDYYGNDGVGVSITKRQASVPGSDYSYYFDGTDDYGSFPTVLASAQEFTFALWLYFPSGNSTGIRSILDDYTNSNEKMSFFMRTDFVNGAGTFVASIGVVTFYHTGYFVPTSIPTDKWVRVVCTMTVDENGYGQAKSYINGEHKETGLNSIAYTAKTWETGNMIACEGNTTRINKSELYMANFYLWDRKLTDAEIITDYNKGNGWYPY